MNCLTASDLPVKTYTEEETRLAAIARQLVHKVRNPLSVITTAGSQLLESADPSADDDELSYANAIVISAEQLETVLRRFSQYACPESADFELVDLNELCRIAVRNIKMDAEPEPHFEIEFIPGNDISDISCDPSQIRVLLNDLLENAIHATLPKGSISVSTHLRGDKAVIVIADDGVGISRENAEKALQPFFSTWPGKSGLGLAIAGRIASSHGGDISIESCSNGGARITLSLPLMDV